MKFLAVVPCYNEKDSIAGVIDDIKKNQQEYSIDVLVVNDCSKDNSSEIVHSKNCIVLDLPVNLGIGGAVQCGYKFAFENNYDIAIQVDGDGQHPAEYITSLIKTLLTEQVDVVIGSRFIEKQGFQSTLARRMGINYFKWLNRILIGVTVNDSTSGYRAFNKKAIELCNAYYPDEYPEPEAIVYFSMNHLKIKEVPVVMKERQGGVSSINSIRSVYYIFKVTLGILFVYLKFRFSKNIQQMEYNSILKEHTRTKA